ncbi:MAG TPA: autotransporter-associated beta strand repeat-containing protein, partial [Prosthecobacter sp.]|nr:autotransporter-associated beta strand repeat-containing protein [Prosthecobacter sp.]
KFNTGFSLVLISAAPIATATTAGTHLNVTTLGRGIGGTGYVASTTLTAERGSRLFVGNSGDFLIGSGAASGTTMGVIPWLAAVNTNGSAVSPDGFATYTAEGGIRALVVATEYATVITAGSTHNVSTNTLTFTGATTVNSLRFTGGSSNIASHQTTGTGQILTVTSGGVFMTSNNGTIGATGSVRAGTLNFGSAEGVIWSNGTNVNTIGALITGSGGLTKAGTGTLILSGANGYGGTTIISGGTLQVGIGGVGRSGIGPMLLNARGTVLSGTGLVQGATTVTFGDIRPGDLGGTSIGTLAFGSDLTFNPPDPTTSAVTTVADLKIFSAVSADKITIGGDLALNKYSRLVVTLDLGYTPIEGDSWDLLDWGGLLTLYSFNVGGQRDGSADNDSNLDLPELTGGLLWNISNFSGNGALTLSIAAVPEPTRALLLLGGMAALMLQRRRRFKGRSGAAPRSL